MKKILFVFIAAFALISCADNSSNETGTGTSIDSSVNTPPINEPDNTTVSPDTTIIAPQQGGVDTRRTGTDTSAGAGVKPESAPTP